MAENTDSSGTGEGGSRAMSAANLFDLRRIIGGLFVGYGVLLTILGLTDSDAEIARAGGININLWAGLGMLVFGALMLLWAFTRPLGEQLEEAAPSQEGGGRSGLDPEGPGGGGNPGS